MEPIWPIWPPPTLGRAVRLPVEPEPVKSMSEDSVDGCTSRSVRSENPAGGVIGFGVGPSTVVNITSLVGLIDPTGIDGTTMAA
ncbi:MAG: hypothetical protein QOF96_419, partial [Actinomycetota bacterium]|nr:hypothetical protein [Actinomycetota bacterium]